MSHGHTPTPHFHPVVPGFGADRAAHYDSQAAIILGGGPAMYDIIASAIVSQLAGRADASLLSVGMGTGADLLPFARFDVPGWRFTGVDPAAAMVDVARGRLEAQGMLARTHLHVGELSTLAPGPRFDGAVMNGVVHHVDGEEARHALLAEVARRLVPGAPLTVGCRVGPDPVLTEVEMTRWAMLGLPQEQLDMMRRGFKEKRPPASDAALHEMLARAGFGSPRLLFASLQYRVWLVRLEAAPG